MDKANTVLIEKARTLPKMQAEKTIVFIMGMQAQSDINCPNFKVNLRKKVSNKKSKTAL